MKDHLKTLGVACITLALIYFVTRDFFLSFVYEHPLTGGFLKFFLLASMGDVIGKRIKSGLWGIPGAFFQKALVWGFIGVTIVLIFKIFPSGVKKLQQDGLLPFQGSKAAFAFFTSLLMNITFAPTMMAFHRMTDTMLENKCGLNVAMEKIDWLQFTRLTLLKTIPFFWIPAHTITFLMPSEYRVIFAALLGIVLGLLLGMTARQKS